MAQVQILYVATANGLRQLANPGKSDRWRLVGTALDEQDVVAVAASATDSLMAFAGSQQGVAQTTDGGASWNTVLEDDIRALVAAPDGSVYAGAANGTIFASDNGRQWRMMCTAPFGVTHLSIAGDRVAAVLSDGSVQLGLATAWEPAAQLHAVDSPVIASGNDPTQLYATTELSLITPDDVMTLDPPPTGALVVVHGKAETLLVATNRMLLRSDDGGRTLQPVVGPVNVRVLVNLAHLIDWVYAGTAQGELWFSKDRGRTWLLLQHDLPAIRGLSFARVI